jgi:hypothetical protein
LEELEQSITTVSRQILSGCALFWVAAAASSVATCGVCAFAFPRIGRQNVQALQLSLRGGDPRNPRSEQTEAHITLLQPLGKDVEGGGSFAGEPSDIRAQWNRPLMATVLEKLLDFNQPLDVHLLDEVFCLRPPIHLSLRQFSHSFVHLFFSNRTEVRINEEGSNWGSRIDFTCSHVNRNSRCRY